MEDSTFSGAELTRQRELLAPIAHKYQLHYLAIYGVGDDSTADHVMEVVRPGRAFEWNLIHSSYLEQACVDMDGVLCRDPSAEENDDGPRYREFIASAEPRWIPKRTIPWIVTSRLEKYRAPTESWLARNTIQYEKLIMVDLPDQQMRNKLHHHSQYKGQFYRSVSSVLFIESAAHQAPEIARISGKAVWCLEDRLMYEPGNLSAIRGLLMNPRSLARRGIGYLRRLPGRLVRPFLPK